MLDQHLRPFIDRSLDRAARSLAHRGASANALTAAGLLFGLIAAVFVAAGLFGVALFFGAVSRVLDGLDGAVARTTHPSILGGYFDILADFTFYAALPLGFVFYDPAQNAVAGAVLLASFFLNATSFLGFAILAEKHDLSSIANGDKSHYHAVGLIEGTETIAFFIICMIWPNLFAWAAYGFAALTGYTIIYRTIWARKAFVN